jgi:hypothetical protein
MTAAQIDFPPTDRTRVKRSFERGRYDRETVHAILDAGRMWQVGWGVVGRPWVRPRAVWRGGGEV